MSIDTIPLKHTLAPRWLVAMLVEVIKLLQISSLELADAVWMDADDIDAAFGGTTRMSVSTYNRIVEYLASYRVHLVRLEPRDRADRKAVFQSYRDKLDLSAAISNVVSTRQLGLNGAARAAKISLSRMTDLIHGHIQGFASGDLREILARLEQEPVPTATLRPTLPEMCRGGEIATPADIQQAYGTATFMELFKKLNKVRISTGLRPLSEGSLPSSRRNRDVMLQLARSMTRSETPLPS